MIFHFLLVTPQPACCQPAHFLLCKLPAASFQVLTDPFNIHSEPVNSTNIINEKIWDKMFFAPWFLFIFFESQLREGSLFYTL